uniref:Uncharacterized protein n=1 Tax=Sipha flava TaxID=143950 RepID=A0A2S2QGE2_9HEMI
MAAAKTGTGPIVQVSAAEADDECTAAAESNAVGSVNDGLKNIALTDDNAAGPASNDVAAGPVVAAGTSRGNGVKAPTFRIPARNSFCKIPGSRAYANRNNGKLAGRVTAAAAVSSDREVVAQDLATASTGATAKAGVALKVLKTETGHEVLNVGEYYYKINTIRWKCGFIENGCYYWLCMMNNKTLCQSIVKTTIINGKHRVVKDDKTHGAKVMKHNHAPLPHAEVLIALLRGD